MMIAQANLIKQHYESLYHSYGQACQKAGFQEDEGPCRLLEDYDLHIYEHIDSLRELPEPVRDAYGFYYEVSEGWSRICQVPYQDSLTYAVCITTDNDGGFLEIYSENGELIGAGRTHIGLISWDSLSEIRQFAYTLEYPSELRSRIRPDS